MTRGRTPASSSDKRRSVSAYVDPEIDAYVRTLAKREEMSVSETVNTLLRRAMMQSDEQKWWDYLGPRIERKIEQSIAAMSNRLAHLSARTALEATAGREMQRRAMVAQATQEIGDAREAEKIIDGIRENAWRYAVGDLKRPSAGVREILGLQTDGDQ